MTTTASIYFSRQQQQIVETWKSLLRFKSISPDPDYRKETADCAEWLSRYLTKLGFNVELITTGSNPILIAKRAGDRTLPSVTLYNHYDVQPAALDDGWSSDPFEPVLRGDRLYARGALDNKGQLMYVLAAVEYLITQQSFQMPMTLCIEGDEEQGSLPLLQALPGIKEKIVADVFIVADMDCIALDAPVITCGVRGHFAGELTVQAGPKDLHSGMHGGLAPNPALVLAEMLTTINDAEGLPKVEGLLNGIERIDTATRAAIRQNKFDRTGYRQKVGVEPLTPPKGLEARERVALYPCFEVLGMASGHYTKGIRNIIPGKAVAKIGMRTGPSQDANELKKILELHLRSLPLHGCSLTLEFHEASPGGFVSPSVPSVRLAKEVLDSLSGGNAGFHWEGATIPLVGPLQQVCGMNPVMIGFGLDEDAIHAADESFSLTQLKYGFIFMVTYLEKLAKDGLPK